MKKLWIPALAGIMLWAAMTLTEAAFGTTPSSQAAQSTYTFTLIAEFGPLSGLEPSALSNGPVITNDGTVVYSVLRGPLPTSSIFSGDGTVPRQLVGFIEHAFKRLQFSVSGNGMMVNNLTQLIIDAHDGTFLGVFAGAGLMVGSGVEHFYEVSINNSGSVAFTGGAIDQCVFGSFLAPNAGLFRFDGETTTTIATIGLPADIFTIIARPSINETGQVAFLVTRLGNLCPSTPGIEAGDLYAGDGKRLVKIAEVLAEPSLNNRGEVGFVAVTGNALSVLVSDGTRTRIVADTNGPFADFRSLFTDGGVSINDPSDVAFIATLDGGGVGIFTGPDVVRDKVIATGDPLAGSSVSGGILMSRQSLNNKGEIAFQATLADGRTVVVRADPKKPGLN